MDPVETNNTHRVFAYGSNMHLTDLGRWAKENGRNPPNIMRSYAAVLHDHALVWNYRSVARRGGAANLATIAGQRVMGVVLEVDGATLDLMDTKEGHPGRYSRGSAPLNLEGIPSGEPVSAWVYRVTERWLCDEEIRPTLAYRRLLVEAAKEHGLPQAYIDELNAIPVLEQGRFSQG